MNNLDKFTFDFDIIATRQSEIDMKTSVGVGKPEFIVEQMK